MEMAQKEDAKKKESAAVEKEMSLLLQGPYLGGGMG